MLESMIRKSGRRFSDQDHAPLRQAMRRLVKRSAAKRAPARARPASRRAGSVRPYHHGDLRRVLIDAAFELVGEGGAEAVSVREAARRAGVSPGAPFRHFASRDALLAA